MIVGDFNNPTATNRSSWQIITKETLELNNTINQMDLTDIYRIFQPSAAQYIFFSAAHGTFFKLDLILGHKASLNKYLKIGITLCSLSDHHGIKLELNSKRNYRKYSNKTLQNSQWATKEIREEINKFPESNENFKKNLPQPVGYSSGSAKGKVKAMSAYIKNTDLKSVSSCCTSSS
jgi:hypothetical protein